MGDERTGRDDAETWQAVLSSLRTQTGWEPVESDRAGQPGMAREVRFHHPRLDGVLLVQATGPVDAATVRAVLYQSLVGTPSRESTFLDRLRARYRAVVERYGTPGVDVPNAPPAVVVATVDPDRTAAERRRIARELECIALDVAHLHDRLHETVTNTESDR